MFESLGKQRAEDTSSRHLTDWVVRAGFALLFLSLGIEKFDSTAGSPWVKLFQQIGFGQWLRLLTASIEIIGAVLLLVPRTTSVAIALLACTMAAAAVVLDFVIRRPADSILSSCLFLGLAAFWWIRRQT